MIKTVLFSPTGTYCGFRVINGTSMHKVDNEYEVSDDLFAHKESLCLVDGVPTLSLSNQKDHVCSVLSHFTDNYLDLVAQKTGYSSAISFLTYAEDDTCPKFQNEAKVFRTWRTQTVLKLHETINLVRDAEVFPVLDLIAYQQSLPVFDLAKAYS